MPVNNYQSTYYKNYNQVQELQKQFEKDRIQKLNKQNQII